MSNVARYSLIAAGVYIEAVCRPLFLIIAPCDDQQTAECHSVLSPRCWREFAVRSRCELLWLHLYLDIFLPTRFQGWLLNKKIK